MALAISIIEAERSRRKLPCQVLSWDGCQPASMMVKRNGRAMSPSPHPFTRFGGSFYNPSHPRCGFFME